MAIQSGYCWLVMRGVRGQNDLVGLIGKTNIYYPTLGELLYAPAPPAKAEKVHYFTSKKRH